MQVKGNIIIFIEEMLLLFVDFEKLFTAKTIYVQTLNV